jgi:hypothetical protein
LKSEVVESEEATGASRRSSQSVNSRRKYFNPIPQNFLFVQATRITPRTGPMTTTLAKRARIVARTATTATLAAIRMGTAFALFLLKPTPV